jgi:UDP-glucose 6-dehydrogenase
MLAVTGDSFPKVGIDVVFVDIKNNRINWLKVKIIYHVTADDPMQRQPDISLAQKN